MAVNPKRRFTKDHPCPICGGCDQRRRGTGERCYGFMSEDGRYAHCTREESAGKLVPNPNSQTFAHRLDGPCGCGKMHGTPVPQARADGTSTGPQRRSRGKPTATWTYSSPDGSTELYRVDRFETPDGKTYRVRRPAPPGWEGCEHREQCRRDKVTCAAGWIFSLSERPCSPAVDWVLYNQAALYVEPPADKTVHTPEGEGCTDALRALGLVAVTSPFGAGKGKWRPEFSEQLAGWHIVIYADADDPGRSFAQEKARSLWGKVPSVKLVDLYPDQHEGEDIGNWIEERKAAGRDVESIRAELQALTAQTPEWRPLEVVSAATTPPPPSAETDSTTSIFLTPQELSSGGDGDDVDWLWEGLLAAGHITLVAGKPRASGKSTLAFGLLRALLHGEPFLGFRTRGIRGAVVLSEETSSTLLDKIRLFGLSQFAQLLIAPRHTTARLTWEEAIAAAVAAAKQMGAELVVVDSFPHFAKLPKDGAKDASLITEAFQPLQAANAQGLGLWLIHQERKGGGEAGEGVRDSGAIVASSDIILELGRLDGGLSRKVDVMSRFRSSPTDFAFRFDRETGLYTPLGDTEERDEERKEQDRERAAREIARLLPTGTGLTQKEIAEKAKLGKSQAGELANRAYDLGVARRSGAGTRNDPYRYSHADVSADADQCRDRRKQTAGDDGASPGHLPLSDERPRGPDDSVPPVAGGH